MFRPTVGAVVTALLACAPTSSYAQAAPAESALAELVAELERANPELKAAQREIDMRVARIAPAGAPPDPTLSIGYMGGLARPFFPSRASGGFQQFAATQELPFPGKLSLRSRVAAADTEVARWSSEDTRLRLIAELKTAYFAYALADRNLAIVLKNKELLKYFARVAEAQFSVGKGLQQDVLKAQLEISLLLERVTMLENRRASLQARINGLLYRPPDTPLNAALSFGTRELPGSADDLRRLAADRYPALKRDERAIDRSRQALALARKEVLPDFAINFSSQRPASDMPWMYGVDFMVKVPVFWQRRQRPMIAEATAALEANKKVRENTVSRTLAQVTEEYVMATTSRRLLDLYEDSVLPQARLALESASAAYQVGTVDFLTLLSNFTAVLNYEVSYEEQRAQYHAALARLEPMVGIELIR